MQLHQSAVWLCAKVAIVSRCFFHGTVASAETENRDGSSQLRYELLGHAMGRTMSSLPSESRAGGSGDALALQTSFHLQHSLQ